MRVPTGQKETWSPPPVALDDGPSGLADARLPLERLLPSALRGRAATEEPEAPSGSSSSGETPAAARREPTPRELDAVERALDEVRGLALPRIELPPAPVAPAPPKERTGP